MQRRLSNPTPPTPNSSRRLFFVSSMVRRTLELKQVRIDIMVKVLKINKSLSGPQSAKNLDILFLPPPLINVLLICLRESKLVQIP